MTTNREVWFAIPSANPELCRRTLPAWREMGYRVAVLQNRHRADLPADEVLWVDEYPGWAQSVNILCREVVPGAAPFVVSGGDDMLPDPETDAPAIAEQTLGHFGGTFGVMQPMGDELLGSRQFCGSPWLGRDWIRRAYSGRGPLNGAYRHNWADADLFWVARCYGRLQIREDLVQRHEHFTRTGDQPPEYWTDAVDCHDRHDVQLFLSRCWGAFPGAAPIGCERSFDRALFDAEYPHNAESHWMARYGRALVVEEGERRLREALERCARDGLGKIAIFGAGSHTRSASGVFMNPPVAIQCIIDDDPRLAGRSLWNYPVLTTEAAAELKPDAVVISSRSMEAALVERASELARRGAAIVTLYDESTRTSGAAA